jgi:hypothetical protein
MLPPARQGAHHLLWMMSFARPAAKVLRQAITEFVERGRRPGRRSRQAGADLEPGWPPSSGGRRELQRRSPAGFIRDPFGGTRAGFSATAELNRQDCGVTTNIPMDGGGVVVGDRIRMVIEIEAILATPQPASRGSS